jgi:fucose 4-O-acetylase-like acetyltransferase
MSSTQSGQTISETLNIAKGLGITLVVIGHVDLAGVQPPFWIAARDVIYTFHMPLFMLLSGVLFAMTQKPLLSVPEYGVFVKKKAKRLMLPYASVTLILLAAKFFAARFFTLSRPVAGDLLYFMLLNPLGGFSNILWFVYTLFVIFLLFPLLKLLVRNELLLFGVTILLSFPPWPRLFCLDLSFQYLPFFAAGCLLQKMSFLENVRPSTGIILPLGLFVVFFAARTHASGFALLSQVIAIALGVSGSLVCIAASALIAEKTRFPAETIAALGMYSSGIYLLHTIFMGAAKVSLTQLMHLGMSEFAAIALVMSLAGLVLPVITEKYFIRRSVVASRFILGVEAKRGDR